MGVAKIQTRFTNWTTQQIRKRLVCHSSQFMQSGQNTVGLTRQSNDIKTISSVQFSHSVMSDSLQPHGPQHTRPPCPSPTPGVYSNSFPLSWWCHPTISSSVVPFSSCPQSFPASGSFPVSQFFTSIRWPKYWSFSFSWNFQWIFRTDFL